ncbi:MAG: class I SAM-dependent methyltransferase [Luteibacter sp.]
MNESSQMRQGHAVFDLVSRRPKGEKIERLLGLDADGTYDMLEVGTGSGYIAHHFATQAQATYNVHSVDVADTRAVTDGYSFQKVASTTLPFPDRSFDVVVTNHVIEHVGDLKAQAHHLAEIQRILRPTGRVYLAVPNRWMLVEPHYGLAFLSWLPRACRSKWLRFWNKGDYYDCEPLQLGEVERLARDAGFLPRNVSTEAFRVLLSVEGKRGLLIRLVSAMPDGFIRAMRRIIPTHVYILTPVVTPRAS